MKNRNFLLLAGLTVITLLVLVLLVATDNPAQQTGNGKLLLPEISDRINHVNRVEIIAAGDNTVATLLKADDTWQLQQMAGYRADWSKLHTLLASLAQAKVVEVKTDKPEYYARLGVEDVSATDAGSVLVELSIDEQVTGVLIGHRAQGRQGQYVRVLGSAASALVDRLLNVSTEQLDWADKRIIDINAAEVAELEIIHPGNERVLVMKISAAQTDFDLAGLPLDRELKSSWSVNSLGAVLSMLDMESVRHDEGVDWGDAVKMRLLMFSGVEIMADLLTIEKPEGETEYLIRLHADHPAANVVADAEGLELQAAEDVAKTVSKINKQTAGWLYVIAKYKYEAMVKKPEDLLKPIETP